MAADKKKISIIIPCHNSSGYLDRTWECLKRQTIGIESLECIFVDDCSNDDGATLKKIKEFEAEKSDSVVIIALSENKGPGGARNIGVQYSSGKYIEFFDSDDELRDDACEALYRCAEDNGADVIQFNHLYLLGDQKRSSNNSKENKLYEIKTKEDRIGFLNSTLVTYGCTNKLYRTSLVKETGVMFPENARYEEPLFVYPLFLYVKKVYILKEDLYLYYINEGSMITSQLGKKLLDHPRVQLMLLEDVMKRKQLFEEYKDIFGIYFLWSFYCETINYAGNYPDAFLPLEYFGYMQSICRTFFSDWKNNPYIYMIPEGGCEILDSINEQFGFQGELNSFLQKVKDLI